MKQVYKRSFSDQILNFILPKFCVHCSKFGHYLCQNCYQKIKFLEKHFCPLCYKPSLDGLTHPGCLTPLAIDGIISAAKYRGPIRSLITKLKYRSYPYRVYEEIDLILKRYFIEQEPIFPPRSILVPVPLHQEKLYTRGFNQAALIANTLRKLWAFVVWPETLIKKTQTKDQAGLSRKQRFRNVKGVYQLNPQKSNSIKGNSFILVDDVVTSGATLRTCARVLKRHQAHKVWAVTLAQD